jgi:hypothetical protein
MSDPGILSKGRTEARKIFLEIMGAKRMELSEKVIIAEYLHDLFIVCPLVWHCLNLMPDWGAKPIPHILQSRNASNHL